jgi:carboxypeptidase C (cathepsin A)
MLTRVLLHMVKPTSGIDAAMHLRTNSQWFRRKVEDASSFIVGNFSNHYLLAAGGDYAKIVNLAAACRIKSCAVENYGMFAVASERFNDTSVEVVEKRIVVIKAVSHRSALSN